jgi:aminopeptidase N
VTTTALTRGEAGERSRLVDVHRYLIDLDLSAPTDGFVSTTTITFGCTEPGAATFVEFIAVTVDDLRLNGRALDPAEVVSGNRIHLTDLAADNELTVHGRCPFMNTGEGLHRFLDPADGRTYLYSQLGPANTGRVFAAFDQPDLKAVVDLTATVPASWVVVANAAVAGVDRLEDGVARWRFATTRPISTYLVAIVAGEYHHIHDVHQGAAGPIPLGLYCRQSMAAHLEATELFELTHQGFAHFEDRFAGPYPFDTYDQVFVPEFNWGAVENVGCVTFRDELLFRSRQADTARDMRTRILLHEMSHMWFGDLVTMRWWDDVWLNESFAEWAGAWAAAAATAQTDAWAAFSRRKGWAYRADQLPSTHPVADEIPDVAALETAFDGITYAKGAAALRQLVALVGEDVFLTGLRAHFADHAYGNATFADLIGALTEASGRDLSGWAAAWLRSTGVSTLRPLVTLDPAGRYARVEVEQTVAGADPTLRPHRLGIGLFDLVDGVLAQRLSLEVDVAGPLTAVPELTGAPAADLLLLNDGDQTYAKIRFDDRSLRTLLAGVGALDDPLARTVCWTALWDMTRDAELPATTWVDTVLAGLATETSTGQLELLLEQGTEAVHHFVAPEHRAAAADRWTAGLRGLLAAAAPGSDRQLALTRALAAAATTADDHDLVAGLLDATAPLPGLVVDVDLRWMLTTTLARAGRLDAADIADAGVSDDTITGRERTATALAARPDADAKAAAWRDAAERTDVANQTRLATAEGFGQAGQEDLLDPYISAYFALADRIEHTTTPMTAASVLAGLFPRVASSATVLAAARDWLSTTTAGPAARRLVAEGAADVERDLAAQTLDARHLDGGR